MESEGRFPFTKPKLAALPIPAKGQRQYYDAGCPGLGIRVSSGGSKTFIRYGRIEGRPTRYVLGTFPDMSVENARKECRIKSGEIADGKNPHAERLQKRREQTVEGLWEHWLETHAKPHKRSWQGDQWLYDSYLKPMASRRLSTLRLADVQSWHAKLGKDHGHYAANRALNLLGAMYGKAHEIGYTGTNPAKNVKRFREEPRDRFLQGDELPRFFAALNVEPDPWPDYFSMLLLTGARRGNVGAMKWEDVNLDAGLWRIPGDVAKAGEVIVVPLLPQALEILRRRAETAGDSPFVFAAKKGKLGHIVEPKTAWKRIIDRAGIEDLRVHDLRRSLGSWMAIQGASMLAIGRALGHREQRSTAIYARLSVDPVRAAMTAGAQAMLTLAKPADQEEEGKADGNT